MTPHPLRPLCLPLAWSVAAIAAGCAPHASGSEAQSFGSATLCADGYLLAVAPERVGALSWQAGSALSSAPPHTHDLPRLSDDPERRLRFGGRIVSGPGGSGAGDVVLEWGEDFDAVRRNIMRVAQAADRPGRAALARIDALSALSVPRTAPRILYLTRSGGSAGAGTYVDAAIRMAGGRNAAVGAGWHTPDIETLLLSEPDMVLTSFFGSDYHGVADRSVRHGALRDFIDRHPRIDIPGRLWPCAGPGLVDATQRIHAAVMDWDANR